VKFLNFRGPGESHVFADIYFVFCLIRLREEVAENVAYAPASLVIRRELKPSKKSRSSFIIAIRLVSLFSEENIGKF